MNVPDHSYAVILAGGGGTRLWPKSRQKHPKHLLRLLGKDSMLQMTFQRISKILPPEKIFVATRFDHLAEAQKQIPEIPAQNWVVEPEAKNTALAMGMAAASIQKVDPDAVVITLHADQMIVEQDAFARAIVGALQTAAKKENIVIVGIRPAFAHTGLGYIRTGEQVDVAEDKRTYVFACRGFKEKPDLTTAQSFLASGQYLWNAGWYCWSVEVFMQAIKDHSPDIAERLEQIIPVLGTNKQEQVMAEVYKDAENVAIDVALTEKAKNLVVIPGEFTWSDIGDWKAIYEAGEKDNKGNVVRDESQFMGLDNRNSLFESNGRLIVAIGVEDLAIIDTDDVLLICAKNKTQDVKKIVEKLKEEKKENLL